MEDGEGPVVETTRHDARPFVLDSIREAIGWFFEFFVILAHAVASVVTHSTLLGTRTRIWTIRPAEHSPTVSLEITRKASGEIVFAARKNQKCKQGPRYESRFHHAFLFAAE